MFDIFYTLNTECLFFVVFGVETPMTASFPSRNGANKCVFPGVTTIVWIGICNGISKTGFSLFVFISITHQQQQTAIKSHEKKEESKRREKTKQTHKLTFNEYEYISFFFSFLQLPELQLV